MEKLQCFKEKVIIAIIKNGETLASAKSLIELGNPNWGYMPEDFWNLLIDMYLNNGTYCQDFLGYLELEREERRKIKGLGWPSVIVNARKNDWFYEQAYYNLDNIYYKMQDNLDAEERELAHLWWRSAREKLERWFKS